MFVAVAANGLPVGILPSRPRYAEGNTQLVVAIHGVRLSRCKTINGTQNPPVDTRLQKQKRHDTLVTLLLTQVAKRAGNSKRSDISALVPYLRFPLRMSRRHVFTLPVCVSPWDLLARENQPDNFNIRPPRPLVRGRRKQLNIPFPRLMTVVQFIAYITVDRTYLLALVPAVLSLGLVVTWANGLGRSLAYRSTKFRNKH